MLIALDISSHRLQVYGTFLASKTSHSDMADSKSPLLRFYYRHRMFIGYCAIGAEVSYLLLYMLADGKTPRSPIEKAHFLETDTELEEAHSVAACSGDTAPPDITSSVDLHFVCFVCVDGGLYKLDGRKKQPIYHGPSSQETLLKEAVTVAQEFVARNPDSVNFNVIALAKQ